MKQQSLSYQVPLCHRRPLTAHHCSLFLLRGWGDWGLGGVEFNCAKMREIVGKLRYSKQPSLPLKEQQFWTRGSDFSFLRKKGGKVCPDTPGALLFY